MLFILSLCNQLPMFIIGDWPWKILGIQVTTAAAMLMTFDSVATVYSLDMHAALAVMNFLNFWFTALLMNGFMIAARDIIWPFQVATHIFPLRYAFEAQVYQLFQASGTYADTLPCSGENATLEFGNCSRSFVCPFPVSPNECFGPTGDEILVSLGAMYDSVKDTNRYALCIGVICAFTVFLKLCFVLRLRQQVQAREIQPPIQD